MTTQLVTAVCGWVAITCVSVSGQQRNSEQPSQQASPRFTVETLELPGLDGAMAPVEVTETERTSSGSVQTVLVRDINGGWRPLEIRSLEVSGDGPEDQVENETVQRRDINGHLVTTDRIVTRRSETNSREQVVIELYSNDADGFVWGDNRIGLGRRVNRTSTVTADGSRLIVEEVEARNPVSPSEPMRVIQRSVATVRQVGPDRWVTERQVYERDVNNRLVPTVTETEITGP